MVTRCHLLEFIPLLNINCCIHRRNISSSKSSTCAVKLRKVFLPNGTKWIREALGDLNQLTLPRLGGSLIKNRADVLTFKGPWVTRYFLCRNSWSWLKIYMLTVSCWFTDWLRLLIEITYWNFHRITQLYNEEFGVDLSFYFTSFCYCCVPIRTQFTHFKRRSIDTNMFRWCRTVLNWLIYYSFFS